MSKTFKHNRHGNAFVLMQVAKKPGYGLDILKRLDDEMPHQIFDSAAIYRSLQYLEEIGAVESDWDTSQKGAPKKNYHITPEGKDYLKQFHNEVLIRLDVLKYLDSEMSKLLEVE